MPTTSRIPKVTIIAPVTSKDVATSPSSGTEIIRARIGAPAIIADCFIGPIVRAA